MPDIDNIAAEMGKYTERIREELIKQFSEQYFQTGKSTEQIIAQISSRDFADEILTNFGVGELYDGVLEEYDEIAAGIAKKIGGASPIVLENLKNIDSLTFYEHIRDAGAELKSTMVRAVYGDYTEKQLRDLLLSSTNKLSQAQVGTILNTNLRSFSRLNTAQAAKELPDDSKWEYAGPVDTDTRDFCAAHAGEIYTLAEAQSLVNDQGGSAWIEGGGWNCRHTWELVEE